VGRKLRPGIDKIDEDWVKKQVRLILDTFPMFYWMPAVGMYGQNGQHDFIILQRGLGWTIETKAGSNKPSESQKLFAKNIQGAGGVSVVINEFNIALAGTIAEYVHQQGMLPWHLNHDFETWTPKKK
jgi:hypothetical protein